MSTFDSISFWEKQGIIIPVNGIFYAISLVFEDQYANIIDKSTTMSSLDVEFYNDLPKRIELMANTQLIKTGLIFSIIFIYLVILYFAYMYSCLIDVLISFDFKKFFSRFHLVMLIVIIDVVPYLFIYPYISKYTSVYCMPVLWNSGQYLLLMNIFYFCYIGNIKSVINSFIFSALSFSFSVFSFYNYFFSRTTQYTNYFNNNYSILIFYFAPMLPFIKDLCYKNIFSKTETNIIVVYFFVTILEEITYLILRWIYPTGNFIFLGGYNKQNTLLILIEIFHEATNLGLLYFPDITIAEKAFGNTISYVGFYVLYPLAFFLAYPPYGYVLLITLNVVIEIGGYIIFITLIGDISVLNEIYFIEKKTEKEILPEKKNEKKTIETPTDTLTPNYSSDLFINNYDIDESSTNYNLEEKVAQLQEEKAMAESDKRSLQSQINSLKNTNQSLTSEVNKLKARFEELERLNESYITDLANKEIEVEKYKK